MMHICTKIFDTLAKSRVFQSASLPFDIELMESLFKSVKDKTVLLAWNNANHSSNVQDTVTELKEHIGGGHLSLEHVERLHIGT